MLNVENLKAHFVIHHNPFARIGHHDHIVRAVDGVSFQIKKGEVLGLIGESGSGKTTLAKTIIALNRPNAGTVLYNNEDIFAMSKTGLLNFRRRVQMIFQDTDSTLDPRMTVKAILEEPLIIHRMGNAAERTRRINEVMEQVNLNDSFLNRYPSELSGGQRQRVAIARTLLLKPEIIIADEPLAGLDNIGKLQILKLLLDIQQALHLSFLLISHDLDLAKFVCDRIMVIYRGKTVETINGEQFEKYACHPYTKFLKGETASVNDELSNTSYHDLPADDTKQCNYLDRCLFRASICYAQSPQWLDIAPGHQVLCHLLPSRKSSDKTEGS